MDYEWASEQLREHVRLTASNFSGSSMAFVLTGSHQEIQASAQIVEKIMDRVTPDWRRRMEPDASGLWKSHREAAVRALAEIERAEEVAEKLGENAPTLNATTMHPWAWEGARSLWQSRHFGEAVRAAATKVNAELQNKVGRRDVSEEALVKEAFSDNPPTPTAARLRLPDDDGGKTAASVRRGIRSLGEVCFAAFRNPASHDPIGNVDEVIALERLATISLLARWIDEATVERASAVA